MKRNTAGIAVVIAGYVIGMTGAVTSSMPAVVFGCFLMAMIVWGDR